MIFLQCLQMLTWNGTTVLVWSLYTCSGGTWSSSLRSADRGQLQTPRYRLTTSGGRSFTCAAPSTWNALPDYLKDTALSLSYFEKQLKTFLFSKY